MVQWLVTAYILCMGIAIPVSGWFVDRFPAKPVYLAALGAFTLASLLAGLPGGIASLIVWRCVQGFSSGVMIQLIQTILMREAGAGNRGRIMALVSIPSVIIPILGPVVGGVILQFLPWRWVFLINVPLCLSALALALPFLPSMPVVNKNKKLDVPGNILLAAGFCAMLMGISGLRGRAGTTGLILLACGIVILGVYTIYALKSSGEVTLDVRLFRIPSFLSCIILMFLYSAVSNGIVFVLPLYLQGTLGMTALMAGLMLAPQGLGMLVTRSWAGGATDKSDPRLVCLLGCVLMILGTLPFVLFGLGTGTAATIFAAISLFVRGMGLGIVMVPITACIYTGLTPAQIAEGTTAQRIFQQIGAAVGTVVMAIMLSEQSSSASGKSGAGALNSGIHFLAAPASYQAVFALSCLILAVMAIPLYFMVKKEKTEKQPSNEPICLTE
jgi:EmrB/QacA subfamily drug resistance transporter